MRSEVATRRWSWLAVFAAAGLLAFASPVPVSAQEPSQTPALGRLSGVILDAEGGRPLIGATITLEPLPHGIVTSPEGGGGGFLESVRVAESDDLGRYAFDGLPEGTYRLRVALLGYRSATMHVDYRGSQESLVSVGLEIEPIQLDAVEVVLDPVIPMTNNPRNEELVGAERIQIEMVRQARYTQADVRSLSSQDVVEAITLGETDLFRALHRLPGVAAQDDWSAELWTRGSRWDETRIYYDGLPLFNPIHAGGVLTAVSPDAVGALMFQPGVRPVGAGDGSAGVVDMASRPAGGDIPVSAMGQVSLVTGRFQIQSPYARGSGVSISGRRTWLDKATEATFETTGDRTLFVPYQFSDVGGRWDQRLSDRYSLEVSGLWSGDQIKGDIPDVLSGNEAEWGNTMFRTTLEGRWSTLRGRLSLGGSRYDAQIVDTEPEPEILLEFPNIVRGRPVSNVIENGQLELTLDKYASEAARMSWRAGLRTRSSHLTYEGPAPVPYPAGADDGDLVYGSRIAQTTGWYEHRLVPTEKLDLRLALQGDLRTPEGGGESSGYLSPRVTAAYALTGDARITAGLGRHYQFEQALAGVGFDLGPRLVPSFLWVQAGEALPALRADIGSLGGELWLGPGVLLSGSAYVRASDGTLVPTPVPGYVRAGPSPEGGLDPSWRTASGVARGIDLSIRRIAGRITGSVAYSYARSELEADGMTFPAPGDRRHTVDATLFLRLASWVRMGGAFTGSTGTPYTRFFTLSCPGDSRCPEGADEDVRDIVGYADAANEGRGPDFSAVDFLLEMEGNVLGLKLGGFLQVKNIGAQSNDGTYLGSFRNCGGAVVDGVCRSPTLLEDRFERGLPVVPLVGFWARF